MGDITKYCNNYQNHIEFIFLMHDLEVTYQKSMKTDLVVDFLRNVNVSWTPKFNDSVQLLCFVPNY